MCLGKWVEVSWEMYGLPTTTVSSPLPYWCCRGPSNPYVVESCDYSISNGHIVWGDNSQPLSFNISCWLILTVVIAHRQCDIDNIVKGLIKNRTGYLIWFV